MKNLQEIAAVVRKLAAAQAELRAQFKMMLEADAGPRSITEEIDAIPGRRIFYNLSGRQVFTLAQNGVRGDAIVFPVSQDGAFIMTHYPMVMWKPNLPLNATNFGQWSPVSSWPVPLQQAATQDSINLSYDFFDGGSQRAFNNEPALPLFSRPDRLEKLPVPTLLAPNSNAQFTAIFEDIFFDAGSAVPTEGGQIVITLPGYRIVNM